MITYRVDDRNYNIGSIIYPKKKQYLRDNDPKVKLKIKVEEILEQYRSETKPCRDGILMLFASIDRAKRHWSLYSNSILYQVEIDPRSILHHGDYNKVEELYKMIEANCEDIEAINIIARDYWSEKNITEPELFVESGCVSCIIGTDSERINHLKSRLGITPFERDKE